MKVAQVAKVLTRIGDYYSTQDDYRRGKMYTFYKAANKILAELGGDHEVDEHYDFTVFEGIVDGPKLYGVYVQGHVDVRGIITFFCEGLYRYRWQAIIHAYLTSRVHGRSCIVQENIRIAAKSL